MAITRRQFFGGALAGWMGWQLWDPGQVALAAAQYQGAAKQARRRLALLIGINRYEARNEWLPLNGCVTDVELQKELLVHRFGFSPKDILTLTDQQATRQSIETAILEHLVAQAMPEDWVVVHFSGHGTLLGGHRALVPVDGAIPHGNTEILDIPEVRLWQWLAAVNSEKILCVLDAGSAYPGTPIVGNFRVRSRPGLKEWQPMSVGLPQLPRGVILRASQTNDQWCADALWSGFSSGVFTYAITQKLWQAVPATSVQVVLNHIRPVLETKGFAPNGPLDGDAAVPLPLEERAADGFLRSVSNDRRSGELWLAGLPLGAMSYYTAGAMLQADEQRLQVRSHNGLIARVEALEGSKLTEGQLARELVRAVPRNLSLVVALDQELSRVERVDATSSLATLPRMVGVGAAEQCADCVLGVRSGSYGLFTPGSVPITGSFGARGESVYAATRRLQPLLESLLAAKLLRLTANVDSSCLGMAASLHATRGDGSSLVLDSQGTGRSPAAASLPQSWVPPFLNIGDRLHCTLANYTDDELYVRLICLDPRGKMLIPSFAVSPYASDGMIPPQQTLTIPRTNAPLDWMISAPNGTVEVCVLVSRNPFTQTNPLLERSLRQAASPTSLALVPNPLEVAQSLLSDLHQGGSEESWLFDVRSLASLSFSYRVV
jgi:hypothetical protein